MPHLKNRSNKVKHACILAALAALVYAAPAPAQYAPTGGGLGTTSMGGGFGTTGTTGGFGTTSGFGTSSLGGGLGTSSTLGGGSLGTSAGLGGTTPGSLSTLSRTTTPGGTGAGLSTGANYTSPGISRANTFASYYANPMSAGLPAGTTQTAFGTAIYASVITASTTTTGTLGTGRLGGLGTGGLGTGSAGGYSGAGSIATPGQTGYVASPAFPSQPAATSKLQTDLQQMLARSTGLAPSRNIRIATDGPTVVLRGKVADDHDRRLAEGLVRLTPGVHDVRNELVIAEATSSAAKSTP